MSPTPRPGAAVPPPCCGLPTGKAPPASGTGGHGILTSEALGSGEEAHPAAALAWAQPEAPAARGAETSSSRSSPAAPPRPAPEGPTPPPRAPAPSAAAGTPLYEAGLRRFSCSGWGIRDSGPGLVGAQSGLCRAGGCACSQSPEQGRCGPEPAAAPGGLGKGRAGQRGSESGAGSGDSLGPRLPAAAAAAAAGLARRAPGPSLRDGLGGRPGDPVGARRETAKGSWLVTLNEDNPPPFPGLGTLPPASPAGLGADGLRCLVPPSPPLPPSSSSIYIDFSAEPVSGLLVALGGRGEEPVR